MLNHVKSYLQCCRQPDVCTWTRCRRVYIYVRTFCAADNRKSVYTWTRCRRVYAYVPSVLPTIGSRYMDEMPAGLGSSLADSGLLNCFCSCLPAWLHNVRLLRQAGCIGTVTDRHAGSQWRSGTPRYSLLNNVVILSC